MVGCVAAGDAEPATSEQVSSARCFSAHSRYGRERVVWFRLDENRNHSDAALQCPCPFSWESLWARSQCGLLTSSKEWAASPSIFGISGGRALSRVPACRSTEPPIRTASRRIRVTVPAAVAVARSRPPRRTSHARLCPHRCWRRLSAFAPCTPERRRSRVISGHRVPDADGSSRHRRPLRSCPARCRTGRHAAAPLPAVESPIPA